MPDIEVFKLITNGGSFAVLVFIALWVMLKVVPMIKDTLEQVSSDSHAAIVALGVAHQEALEQQGKECREERREMMETAAVEREEDRKSRHDLADKMQNIIRDAVRVPLR